MWFGNSCVSDTISIILLYILYYLIYHFLSVIIIVIAIVPWLEIWYYLWKSHLNNWVRPQEFKWMYIYLYSLCLVALLLLHSLGIWMTLVILILSRISGGVCILHVERSLDCGGLPVPCTADFPQPRSLQQKWYVDHFLKSLTWYHNIIRLSFSHLTWNITLVVWLFKKNIETWYSWYCSRCGITCTTCTIGQQFNQMNIVNQATGYHRWWSTKKLLKNGATRSLHPNPKNWWNLCRNRWVVLLTFKTFTKPFTL